MNPSQPVLVKAPVLLLENLLADPKGCETDLGGATDILVVKSGGVHVLVKGISYTLTSSEMLVVPRIRYRLQADGKGAELLRLRLSGFAYSGYEEGEWPFIEGEVLFSEGGTTRRLLAVLEGIEAEHTERLFGYEQSVKKLLDYLLILLERELAERGEQYATPQSQLDGIKQYIEKNYEKNITLASLAETFFVSPFHISHEFKEKYNISPIQYLIHVRIQAAAEMLAQTDYTVSQIAGMVGYPNANYFHILFKRFVGTSPGSYRKQKK